MLFLCLQEFRHMGHTKRISVSVDIDRYCFCFLSVHL